jgi:O-antigen/teichoic acid export membrane protein
MKLINRTTSGAMANLGAQAVPFVLLMLVTPVLLKSLGREQYGALVLFNLIPQIAGQLDLGIATAATRGFAQYSAKTESHRARRLFREALTLLAAWGALLGAAFFALHVEIAAALNFGEVVDAHSLIYVAAAISIPLALMNVAALVPLRALERYGSAARIQIVGGVLYWSICAFWANRGGTLVAFVMLGTATVVLTTIALFVAARESMATTATLESSSLDAHPKAAIAASNEGFLLGPYLGVGAGAFIAQASSLATFHADKLLVSALVSPAAAGAYTICANIANKILLVIASAATFTFPRAAHLHASGDLAGLAAIYRDTARICATLAACAVVPIVGLAHAFLNLWLGEAFGDQYAIVLQLLAAGYTLAACSVVSANVAMGIGNARMPATFAALGGCLTIGALVVLTPPYGIVGAAFAALIGMSQAVVFNALIARRLGKAAMEASWPLLVRLLIVAAPLALLIASLQSTIDSWPRLVVVGIAASFVFPVVWCMTFGRKHEWPIIKRAISSSIRLWTS